MSNDNHTTLLAERFILKKPDCVCVFCGATKQSHPQRAFVTNGRIDLCSGCVDEAVVLINNADLLENDQKFLRSLEEHLGGEST